MYRIACPILVFSAGVLFWTFRGGKEQTLLKGEFHSVAHRGSGEARLARLADGTRVLRLVDLKTYPGLDLEVCLAGLPDAEDNESVIGAAPVCLGGYESKTAYRSYPVPASIDLARYRAVVIWSRNYRVNFTTAPMSP